LTNTIGSVEAILTNEGTHLLDAQNESQNYDTESNQDQIIQTDDDDNEVAIENDDNNDNNDNEEIHENQNQDVGEEITTLTNRLRVLFYTLYIPIIPLSGVLFILLLQLVMKTIASPPCSYPLRFFAILSLLLFVYTPNHKAVKRYLFNYSRERDGIIRPRSVRMYDQSFHMICLLYIYLDMMLIQSCQEDVDINHVSTCTTTCPELYEWFIRFDLVLKIFAAIILLPLVCLPFVYMWIIRRIHTAEALLRFERGLNGNAARDEDYLAGRVLVKEIMEGLREVVLVKVVVTAKTMIKVLGKGNEESWSGDKLREKDAVKDCCICMSDFYCEGEIDELESDRDVNGNEGSTSQQCIVETKCGHLFHKACIGGWIGGRDWEVASAALNTRARRKCCPLCREDLALNGSDQA
jgi:hypothetical protein